MDSGDATGVTQRLPIALTIAGSDSGGGAGIQADLKTFAALGVYGACVITALTAQNTRGVRTIHTPPTGIVGAQIDAVLEDFAVAAIKIGMLGSAEIANVVAARLPSPHSPSRDGRPLGGGRETLLPSGEGGPVGPFARTPVSRRATAPDEGLPHLRSRHDRLLRRRAERRGFVEAVRHALLPLVDCLTPNLAEAAALLRRADR